MPTVEQNVAMWDRQYAWSGHGDEWSERWGGTEAMWQCVLHPRVYRFLRVPTILEIAPGHGRWTQYLKDACDSLIVVDLSETCIAACRERFAGESHIQYHVNDGTSLAMVPDGSVDFVFSFDSLVHAEADVLEAYVGQLTRKLKPTGAGFIHHSNAGAYSGRLALHRKASRVLVNRAGHFLRNRLIINPAWRAEDVTAARFAGWCDRAGIPCAGQELVNWLNWACLIDCFSVFAPAGSPHAHPNRVWSNRRFMREAAQARRFAAQYLR